MDERLLPLPEIAKLKAAHRHAKTRREADRIKAVVLLGKGWTSAEVAEALLLDENTVSGTTLHGIAGEGFRRCGRTVTWVDLAISTRPRGKPWRPI